MKKFLVMRIFCALILVIGLVSSSQGAAIQVTQPAFDNMSFYVYKVNDKNFPSDIYATYDDYLVYRNFKKVWYYASYENGKAVKTNYVVGSVVPSVVNIKAYKPSTSSVAPVLNTDRTNPPLPKIKIVSRSAVPEVLPVKPEVPAPISVPSNPGSSRGIPVGPQPPQVTTPGNSQQVTLPSTPQQVTVPGKSQVVANPPKVTVPEILPVDDTPKYARVVYMPPSSGLEAGNNTYTYSGQFNDDWTQNPNFMAISKWQKSVDRIGVLDSPAIPVAWKGDYPEVIYAWTGLQWEQIIPRGTRVNAATALQRNVFKLTRTTSASSLLNWTIDDTHVLSQYALMWGYEWLGQIILRRQY